jgi:plasmid stabilization system protein ParE
MGAYLSPQAESDLETIFEQIRRRSPKNAVEFLERVEEALDRVERAPRTPRLRDDQLPISGLRFAYANPAVLIYNVLENDDAEIVRVAHKRQDFAALFDEPH